LTLMRAPTRWGAAVVVTRPGEPGQRLSAGLRDLGLAALWWPAFDLLPPLNGGALQSIAQRLAEFDLVVFVSPASVRAWANVDLRAQWPAATAIAGVGATTLRLARSLLAGAGAARGIAPSAGADLAGSEGLWETLRRQTPLPQKVLIVRAESGRDWLADRLREAGAQVECASVYRRLMHAPSPEQRAALGACRAAGAFATTVVTSSEAVAALDSQLEQAADLQAWLRQGLVLASHPRIAQALSTAGYGRVQQCEPEILQVAEAIGREGSSERGRRLAESITR
jgi:uroporphyrinogen-III synthase